MQAVTNMTSDVPTQAERMPASSGKREGNEKKKWEEKRELPSMANAAISASNVNELTNMAMRPTIAKTALRNFYCHGDRSLSLGCPPKPLFQDVPGNVKH